MTSAEHPYALEPTQRMLEFLRAEPDPLFAILDAARGRELAELVHQSGEEHESLFSGMQGQLLADVAPYLVRLRRTSVFLETLVQYGWGRSSEMFLACQLPFVQVRRHLRRFLLVQTEDGDKLYFRFYDPRVLPVFLRACTPEECQRFFGDIRCFLVRSQDARTLLRLSFTGNKLVSEHIPLTTEPPRNHE
jgi:hypothetical protein